MEKYSKKQTSTGRQPAKAKKVEVKKYLSSVKEYDPEVIKGYTYAF